MRMCYLQSLIDKFLGLDMAGCRDRGYRRLVEDDSINVSAYMYVQRFSCSWGLGLLGVLRVVVVFECKKKTHPTEEGVFLI